MPKAPTGYDAVVFNGGHNPHGRLSFMEGHVLSVLGFKAGALSETAMYRFLDFTPYVLREDLTDSETAMRAAWRKHLGLSQHDTGMWHVSDDGFKLLIDDYFAQNHRESAKALHVLDHFHKPLPGGPRTTRIIGSTLDWFGTRVGSDVLGQISHAARGLNVYTQNLSKAYVAAWETLDDRANPQLDLLHSFSKVSGIESTPYDLHAMQAAVSWLGTEAGQAMIADYHTGLDALLLQRREERRALLRDTAPV